MYTDEWEHYPLNDLSGAYAARQMGPLELSVEHIAGKHYRAWVYYGPEIDDGFVLAPIEGLEEAKKTVEAVAEQYLWDQHAQAVGL